LILQVVKVDTSIGGSTPILLVEEKT